MSKAPATDDENRLVEGAWSIDELAQHVGLTSRTTRYYASLGLIPPPTGRRGRVAVYDDRHRVRLMMICTMQERGFSLAGIEQQLRRLPDDTPPEELQLRLVLVSSWAPPPIEVVDRVGLETRSGRTLSDEEIDMLELLGTLKRRDDGFQVFPTFKVGVGLLDARIPISAAEAAGSVIRDAMSDLVLRLSDIMRNEVVGPYRAHNLLDGDAKELEVMLTSLRQLTLEAVVANYQHATNRLSDSAWI